MTARSQALDMLRAVARKDASGRIVHQFATDPKRIDRMSVEAAGLYLDLSKQSWSAEGFEAAVDLARTCDVEGRRNALFGGEGLSVATLEGDGQVILQSVTIDALAKALEKNMGVGDKKTGAGMGGLFSGSAD